MTVRVSDRGGFGKSTYPVYVHLTSAEGLTYRTPVEIAGIQVGFVDDFELVEGRTARLRLQIREDVQLPVDVQAQVRTKGFLGETYIDIVPGQSSEKIVPGGDIVAVNPYIDFSQLTADIHDILSGDDEASLKKILKNLAVFSENLSSFSEKNNQNWDSIVENMAHLSQDLREIVQQNREIMNETMERLASVVRKIDEGRGSLGQLINDDRTVENLNNTLQGLNETIGGVSRFQTEIGYHLEFLGQTEAFKNYVSLALKPRPDKYFLLEFVVDPNPSPVETITTTNVTTGGATTAVTTQTSRIDKNKFLISAQLAKQFHDFTVRGGIIESRGGGGLDYSRGPFGLEFSAYDFRTDNNQRPHLKVMGTVNLTDNIFLLSGVDDMINPQQDPDWFVGAGLQFVDEDIRSLFGAVKLSP